ncbi:MAG: hypothetical protein CME06_18185 [Gemmatimonadetes bacterium]|nr:hypothetical protein [Gemmatimonadota bacterium]
MSTEPRPEAGVDYPRTFHELDTWSSTEDSFRAYLRRLRWPGGFHCPRCGARTDPWTTARGCLHCRSCGGEASITAGTIFEGTTRSKSIVVVAAQCRPRGALSSRTLPGQW